MILARIDILKGRVDYSRVCGDDPDINLLEKDGVLLVPRMRG